MSNIHHNMPLQLLNMQFQLFNALFTPEELGVTLIYDANNNAFAFDRYDPLWKLGRQINLTPLPHGEEGMLAPAEGAASPHNWSKPHVALNQAANEFVEAWAENHQRMVAAELPIEVADRVRKNWGQSCGFFLRVNAIRDAMRALQGRCNIGGRTVEIKTGERRIIEYLLSPLLRYKQESLRER